MTYSLKTIASFITALSASILMTSGIALASESNDFTARVLVYSPERVDYRSDISVPVSKANVREGMSFKQGDILVEFDCTQLDAQTQAAKAAVNAASIEHRTKKRLHQYQAAGKSEVQLAAAKAVEARAQLKVQQAANRSCAFEAPFDGRVVALNALAHEHPPADKPVITIIKDSALELELIVPSIWLRWLKAGEGFDLAIDETGETGSARVERIGAEVDPVSQTIKLIAVFQAQPTSVLAGMSGTARFKPVRELGLLK
jgi:multidrug efflux pump subunit AcrA (membrane-fusion protein)